MRRDAVWGTCPRCSARVDHLNYTEQVSGRSWFNEQGEQEDSESDDYDCFESTCPECHRGLGARDLLDISTEQSVDDDELIEAEPEEQDAWKGLV